MLGIMVHGGAGPLEALGVPSDAALTPFAGSYRFLDLALATFANSGVRCLGDTRQSAARGPRVVPLSSTRGGRAARVLEALRRLSSGSRLGGVSTVAVLSADHVLQVDLRELHGLHRDLRADVTLAALPIPFGEDAPRTMLLASRDRTLVEVRHSAATAVTDLSWAGDLLVSTRALPALLAALTPDVPRDDVSVLTRLAERLHVVVHDVGDGGLPGLGQAHGTYWHDPTSVESYYTAQMDLCGPRPGLDFFNPAWPLPAAPSPFGPAKMALDEAGRPGQTLGCLVSDGAVIRGGMVANCVLGHGVVVESGAELEDCVLMDACHVGRYARLRRTIVAAGAIVPDGVEIGYGATPDWAQERASGLTIVTPDPRLRLGPGVESESSALGA
jgi:glucose-1-phosphate adenylyltransferase